MIFLSTICLTNFRCYGKNEFRFSPGINILIGDNAVGKTTVAEAVFCLGLGRSHRAGSDSEIIRFGQESASVTGIFLRDGKTDEISMHITGNGKRIIRNNKKISR
jgi:DNA replication and repair protein RecF